MLMRFPACGDIDNLPADWEPPAIGTVAEIRVRLEEAFPDAQHVDGQTSVRGPGFSVDFDYSVPPESDGQVRAVAIISSPSPYAIPVFTLACECLNVLMYDYQSGQITPGSDGTLESIRTFSEWRKHALGSVAPERERRELP